LISDLGDAIEHDREVRQARRIADAARRRLVACMTGAQDVIDPAEAQRMLDAFKGAVAHAEDAEDRVLMHRGLLTSVEAGRRAADRRSAASRSQASRTDGGRTGTGASRTGAGRQVTVAPARPAKIAGRARRVVGWAVAVVAAGSVGMALARWLGVRPPLTRW